MPLGGQSFNPSAKDHKSVLEKVVKEEVSAIEKDLKGSITQQAFENRVERE